MRLILCWDGGNELLLSAGVIPKGVDGQPLVGNTADEMMTSASLPSPGPELP